MFDRLKDGQGYGVDGHGSGGWLRSANVVAVL